MRTNALSLLIAQRPRPESQVSQVQIDATPVGSDPVTITGGKINGNILELDVRHAGNKPHDYQLSWEGGFEESFPVQTSLELSHHARGDTAGQVSKTLKFDLTPMRDAYRRMYREEHAMITFWVPGAPAGFAYQF